MLLVCRLCSCLGSGIINDLVSVCLGRINDTVVFQVCFCSGFVGSFLFLIINAFDRILILCLEGIGILLCFLCIRIGLFDVFCSLIEDLVYSSKKELFKK